MREFRKNKFKKTLKNRQKGGFGKPKSENEIAKQEEVNVNDLYNATLKKYLGIFEITNEGTAKWVSSLISLYPQLITDLIKAIKYQAVSMKYPTIPSNEVQLTKIVTEALKNFLENTKRQYWTPVSIALKTARVTENTLLTKQRVQNIFQEEPKHESNLVVHFIRDLEILKRGTKNINKTLPETYKFPLLVSNPLVSGDPPASASPESAPVPTYIEEPVSEEVNNPLVAKESNSVSSDIPQSAFEASENQQTIREPDSVQQVANQQANKDPYKYTETDLEHDIEALMVNIQKLNRQRQRQCPVQAAASFLQGGSKKNRTSKRHIKRRTKRHTQYKKRRHTKKRN